MEETTSRPEPGRQVVYTLCRPTAGAPFIRDNLINLIVPAGPNLITDQG